MAARPARFDPLLSGHKLSQCDRNSLVGLVVSPKHFNGLGTTAFRESSPRGVHDNLRDPLPLRGEVAAQRLERRTILRAKTRPSGTRV